MFISIRPSSGSQILESHPKLKKANLSANLIYQPSQKRRRPLVTLTALITLTLLACTPTQKPSVVEEPPVESPAPDRFTLVRLKASDGSLETLLKAEVQRATQQGRQPFAEFYADWCPPCNALHQNLSDPRMIDAFEGTYIIQLNLDEWKEQLSQTDFVAPGIPILFSIAQAKPNIFYAAGTGSEMSPFHFA